VQRTFQLKLTPPLDQPRIPGVLTVATKKPKLVLVPNPLVIQVLTEERPTVTLGQRLQMTVHTVDPSSPKMVIEGTCELLPKQRKPFMRPAKMAATG